MKRLRSWFPVTGTVLIALASAGVAEDEARTIVGADVGVVQPIEAFDVYTDTGGIISPFLGYMFNRKLGLMGQLHALGAPNFDRVGVRDDDATWIIGGTAGPRVALPLGGGELYGTAQGGIFTGLAPHSVTDTSFGVSTGAGLNAPLTDDVLAGVWIRWNRLYQRVHGKGDVQYVSAGLGFTFDLGGKKAPAPLAPAPEPVVQAPPPPPAPPAPKKKIVLRGVNFDFNKADIRADARPVLDEAVAVLKSEPAISVVAEGHTDSVGSDEYNKMLSLRRARAVASYLVKSGISASRIRVEGKGESMPVASNATEDGRAQNRRVELKVVD